MGFLSNFFGGSEASDAETLPGDGLTTCDSCGNEVDESELAGGYCEECQSDYSGTKYCCGAIYEEGEDTCMSCGESL